MILPNFKTNPFEKLIFLIIAFAIFSACNRDKNSNWPQFRGPNSNQIALEKDLPGEWSMQNNLLWKVDLSGRGWSCPIVWGNQVFFTNAVLEDPSVLPPAEEGRRQDNPDSTIYNFEIICLDIDTGK